MQLKLTGPQEPLLHLHDLKCQLIHVIYPTPFPAWRLCRSALYIPVQSARRRDSFQNLLLGQKVYPASFVHTVKIPNPELVAVSESAKCLLTKCPCFNGCQPQSHPLAS